MAKKDDSAYIEDQYRAKRQLSSIVKKLGFHQSRLTEMITKNEAIQLLHDPQPWPGFRFHCIKE